MKPNLRRIRAALSDCRLGRPLIYLDETGSTNDEVKRRAEAGEPEGLVVWAGSQTRGRGRQGRSWLSVPGRGLTFSVLIRPRWPAGDGLFLNLFAAAAVARAFAFWHPVPAGLKWPNDVLLNGRKAAGVLAEPRIRRGVIEFAVIGIGINVSHTAVDLAPLGRSDVTSLGLEGIEAECGEVLVRTLQELDAGYLMAQQPDKGRILREWAARAAGPAGAPASRGKAAGV